MLWPANGNRGNAVIGRGRERWLAAVMVLAMFGVAACADDGDSEESTGGGGGAAEVSCGAGDERQADGEPIRVGAIVGETGADDFSSSADAAAAYFECVNAHGGINGRPIEYLVEDDRWDPEVAGQAAARW